ncbi:hybrid sensor histidine kinase/response regulator [Bacteriovorax sp. PP10]|uniref:histidine kinase n=1 Tax=Bacteriovorax antarcticus TaxID=3088717 RepID=A0ABU5VXL3_9BACT|nr:hybrid sensor histidine kinase/response regulator [Bacteriovorax sp. PP10]MEA9357802.1 hybrid sensor histidine kinase/response regulator [Bacteriovorax sp. PP10]
MHGSNITEKLDILIVDDVKENLFALTELLKTENINILEAQSGNEALELMVVHDFSVALVDIQMPGMNGFELAEFMRGTKKTKNIPIIFVTATANDEKYAFKGYESGAVDFLRKPLDPHVVKSKVKVFLEMHQNKKELEKQVEALNIIRDKLEQANRAREEFMAIATHELKTPLTVLKLQAQNRQRSLEKGSLSAFTPEKLIKMFDSDSKQILRLNRLIDDMLDVSRISSGQLTMNFEDCDLSLLISEVYEGQLMLFKAAGVHIEMNSCESIIGRWDKLRIGQVITNLLTNAIRYGDGKPVKIHVRKGDEHAVVTVEDHGIGIAEENVERIFQRFERATGTEANGLGLGLYIVNQIIEAHDGFINVKSHLGAGSIFTVHLSLNL